MNNEEFERLKQEKENKNDELDKLISNLQERKNLSNVGKSQKDNTNKNAKNPPYYNDDDEYDEDLLKKAKRKRKKQEEELEIAQRQMKEEEQRNRDLQRNKNQTTINPKKPKEDNEEEESPSQKSEEKKSLKSEENTNTLNQRKENDKSNNQPLKINKASLKGVNESSTKIGQDVSTSNIPKMGQNARTVSKAASTVGKTASKARKAAKTGKIAAMLAGTPIGWVIGIIIAVIFGILMLIGLISFFHTMTDTVSGKLQEFSEKIYVAVFSNFFDKAELMVSDDDIVDVAKYLDNMGYDLEGYGFGKIVKRNEQTNEIEKIKSTYLRAYLTAENKTYLISNESISLQNIFGNIIGALIGDEELDKDNWGSGMIVLDKSIPQEILSNINEKISIDRSSKVLEIKVGNDVVYCSLQDWVGKYGKPLEFLLALHLGTLAPDFAYDIATNKDIDTKVHIELHEVNATTKVIYKSNDGTYIDDVASIPDSEISNYPITKEQVDKAKEYTNTHKTYTPYITKVDKHWYRDLVFKNENPDWTCYQEVEEIKKDPVPVMDDDTLGSNFYIVETRSADIEQYRAPLYVDEEKPIIKFLENNEYKIYDGIVRPDNSIRAKRKITPTDTMLSAITLLTATNTESAEYIARDLRELFSNYGFLFEDEYVLSDSNKIDILDIYDKTSGYIDANKNIIMHERLKKIVEHSETVEVKGNQLIIKHKTETKEGFETGDEVTSPGSGEIIDKTDNSIVIRLSNGMTVVISDIIIDSNLQVGNNIANGKAIGKTTDKSIIITMKNKKGEAVNPGKYIPTSNSVSGIALGPSEFRIKPEVEQMIETMAGPYEAKYPGIVNMLKAITMNESGGGYSKKAGVNVFQVVGSRINSLQDSVKGGIYHLTNRLDAIKAKGITDVRVALQSYNYGIQFVGYVSNRGGVYTKELSYEFSRMKKAQTGYRIYGDPEYVTKLSKYINFGQ